MDPLITQLKHYSFKTSTMIVTVSLFEEQKFEKKLYIKLVVNELSTNETYNNIYYFKDLFGDNYRPTIILLKWEYPLMNENLYVQRVYSELCYKLKDLTHYLYKAQYSDVIELRIYDTENNLGYISIKLKSDNQKTGGDNEKVIDNQGFGHNIAELLKLCEPIEKELMNSITLSETRYEELHKQLINIDDKLSAECVEEMEKLDEKEKDLKNQLDNLEFQRKLIRAKSRFQSNYFPLLRMRATKLKNDV